MPWWQGAGLSGVTLMAHTIDSISISGLRKAHLRQLVAYIHHRDEDGWYYGPRGLFEKRHKDLLELADGLEAIADDPDARIAEKALKGFQNRLT